MKILFTPFSLLAGVLAGLIATKIFDFIWGRVADEEPPEPDQRDISWPSLIAATLVQGAIFRATRALVDRGARVGFARATGSWPGEKRPDPA